MPSDSTGPGGGDEANGKGSSSGERAPSDEGTSDFVATTDGYSIRVTSRMTGISAHTLRMWERRYGFPDPARTKGGARRYTNEDVERLRLVQKALDAGFRPHEAVPKDMEALERIVAEQVLATVRPTGQGAPTVDRLIEHVRNNDFDRVRADLRAAVAVLGPRRFVLDFAGPVLDAVGAGWEDGEVSIQQEHMMTEMLATQLRSLYAGYEGLEGRPEVLLTTLPGERHAMGLLLVALYLALHGAKARLLGPDSPVDQIAVAAGSWQIDVVGLSVSRHAPDDTAQMVADLVAELPRRVEVWVGGRGAPRLGKLPPGARLVDEFDLLERELARWRQTR